jgi:DNA-binding transcriptional ArsR family regulator
MVIDVLIQKQTREVLERETLPVKEQHKPLDLEQSLGIAAFVGKSLSDENRLRILSSLCKGKKTVSTIVEEMNLSQPLVSHHLKELRRCLLVKVERKGLFVYYEIADERIINIIRQLAHLATDLLSQRDTF